MLKLKPCPFCGSKSASVVWVYNSERAVECMNKKCSAKGPSRKTDRGAISAWNKRS